MAEPWAKEYLEEPRTDGTSTYRSVQPRRDERKLPAGNWLRSNAGWPIEKACPKGRYVVPMTREWGSSRYSTGIQLLSDEKTYVAVVRDTTFHRM